jgi:hypothetical protein
MLVDRLQGENIKRMYFLVQKQMCSGSNQSSQLSRFIGLYHLKSCKDPAFSSIPKGATILGVKNLDSHTRQVFYRNQKTFTVDDQKNTCELNPGQYLYDENGPGWVPPKAIEMVNKNDWIRDYWWVLILLLVGMVIVFVTIMGLVKLNKK